MQAGPDPEARGEVFIRPNTIALIRPLPFASVTDERALHWLLPQASPAMAAVTAIGPS